jgi:phosphoglycerate dehydrogenase-like enzyme
MVRIVLLGRMAAWCEEEIAKRLTCEHEITVGENMDAIERADVIVGWPLSAKAAAQAKNLKLLQAAGAGLDGIDFTALGPSVRVANTYHHEVAIAEYVLMAMMILARRPAMYDSLLRKGDWWGSCIWGETPVMRELYGQTVLLIGLGHIAREVAVRAKAFGMRVVGASRNLHEGPYDEVVPFSEWQERLPEADWVVPCCPLTPETTNLIAAPQIERMKKSSRLINITRGRVLHEEDVFEALRTKRIAGAALDVWYQYPSDPDEVCFPSRFPFHELDNVFMSPHNSGWTLRTIMTRVEDIADNINRLAEGRELKNLVR